MPIEKAKKLLEDPSSSLNDLVDCLNSLSINQGYVEAAKKAGLYHSKTAHEIITELNFYIEQIKARIKNYN